ncbi:hypothetical protein ACFYXH_30465 [Streptomyces sp. NPDC002730]|uniref:hypothetical protein n=1 Tax=Streptomyces sp. NPDC002730 TaxID=3364662 RepID=UPI0036BF6603
MTGTPIVVHRISATGGRRVTVRDQNMGLAHSDRDLLEFLRQAGLPDAEDLLDDPTWVEWVGGGAHEYQPDGPP